MATLFHSGRKARLGNAVVLWTQSLPKVKKHYSLTTLAGLHVAMLFEWCVQALPSGHVGPPATAGKKRRFGKGLHKRRWWHVRRSSKEVEAYWCMFCATHALWSPALDTSPRARH